MQQTPTRRVHALLGVFELNDRCILLGFQCEDTQVSRDLIKPRLPSGIEEVCQYRIVFGAAPRMNKRWSEDSVPASVDYKLG